MYIAIFFLIGAAADAAAPLRVVLDPGHGGRDQGAVVASLRESDLTLDVARRLRRLLDADPRFEARLTRADDTKLPLKSRTRLAGDLRADLFVSIHVNSSPDPRARGAEFYFRNELPADEESAFLAHREDELGRGDGATGAAPTTDVPGDLAPEMAAIVSDLLDGDRVLKSSRLTKSLRTAWTGSRKTAANSVRQAPFFVLSQIAMPSALVELGFLTNAEDRARLGSPPAREAMAKDLYQGLARYRAEFGATRLQRSANSFTQGHASR